MEWDYWIFLWIKITFVIYAFTEDDSDEDESGSEEESEEESETVAPAAEKLEELEIKEK